MGGHLWDLIDKHREAGQYPPSYRQIAMSAGVNPSTFMKWKTIKDLPAQENLQAVARVIGVSYERVLTAALADIAYIRDPAALAKEYHFEPVPEGVEIVNPTQNTSTPAITELHGQAVIIWAAEDANGARVYGSAPARAFLPRRTYPIAVLTVDGSLTRITTDELPDDDWMAGELARLRRRAENANRTVRLETTASLVTTDDLVAIDASASANPNTMLAWANHLTALGVEVVLLATQVFPFTGNVNVGGGGTSFPALVEHVEAREISPQHVFVLTDGFGAHVTPAHPENWTWLLLPGGSDWMSERKTPMRVFHIAS